MASLRQIVKAVQLDITVMHLDSKAQLDLVLLAFSVVVDRRSQLLSSRSTLLAFILMGNVQKDSTALKELPHLNAVHQDLTVIRQEPSSARNALQASIVSVQD